MSAALAIAHPNVALSKYWGKREGCGNFPAVPSLSVTLGGLATRTHVRFDHRVPEDRVVLDGRAAEPRERVRVVELLDRVRSASGESRRAEVVTRNDFPTAGGLASSASGFAALALCAVRAAGLDWDAERVSDLARRSSASAARSVFGGFVELDAGPVAPREVDFLAARPLAPPEHLPLAVLVCITTENAKAIGSTAGMRATMERSPYASAWLEAAPRLHERLREALLARDFSAVGQLAEASALAMHASAMAAGVLYWTAATLEALSAVHALRARGIEAYATIDAGPHVKVLVRPDDAACATEAMAAVPGVRRIIQSRTGTAAALLDDAGAAA
ncbi:MAG TPA: diphosphomevalonate decarboxylase [Polyangiaceae bacterium]|nr:diphosphomevalonate decarboxylase [Polyangiaceae bacterium]